MFSAEMFHDDPDERGRNSSLSGSDASTEGGLNAGVGSLDSWSEAVLTPNSGCGEVNVPFVDNDEGLDAEAEYITLYTLRLVGHVFVPGMQLSAGDTRSSTKCDKTGEGKTGTVERSLNALKNAFGMRPRSGSESALSTKGYHDYIFRVNVESGEASTNLPWYVKKGIANSTNCERQY